MSQEFSPAVIIIITTTTTTTTTTMALHTPGNEQ
jgi:hypothetical protein